MTTPAAAPTPAGSDLPIDDICLIRPEAPPPAYEPLVGLLNQLYTAESRSFFRYLETWQPYTNAKTIKLRTLVRAMMKSSYDHADRLAHLIASLGGTTTPGAFSNSASFSNDTGWANLLPRFIAAKVDMIARYDRALAQLEGRPGADQARPILESLNEENREHQRQLLHWREALAV